MSDRIDRLNEALGGRYALERELGEGGMATVYLADDLKHRRKVAVKVLKPELAAMVGAERFLAEIETTANLQHPHILPLFDSGEADGFLFYVMPYVEGESLRDRLDRERQLPVDEAARIASDVGEALHAAHERGVIHRDVKPANILLSGGRPLVADFGIALAVSNAGGGRLTETGLSMGTPYYMSPEQAAADRDPTAASDQYSLACVLYEMLVGEPPFPGPSAQAVLARILTSEAEPPSTHRKSVPPNVDAVVVRGLEKLPADRFADMREMVRALRDGGHRYGAGAARRGPGDARRKVASLLPWVLVAVLGLLLAAPWGTGETGAAGHDPIRVAIPMDEGSLIPLGPLMPLGLDGVAFDVTADGRTVVHLGWDGETLRLHRRSLDGYESTALAGTEGAATPFVSPDGRWVAYFAEGGLWKIPMAGGEPTRLANAPNGRGGFWGEDGRIWFNTQESRRLLSVPADGGEVRVEGRRGTFSNPLPLPGAGRLLVSDAGGPPVTSLWSGDGPSRAVVEGATPQLVPPDLLTFVRGRTLYAARLDPDEARITTPPVPVLDGLRSQGSSASYRMSDDGTLFYLPGVNAQVVVPVLLGGDGSADSLPIPAAAYGHLAISPDLGRIATYEGSSDFQLSVFDVESGRARLLDRAPGLSQALWSHGGDRVAYSRQPVEGEDDWEIVVRTVDSTEEVVVGRWPRGPVVSGWAPDDSTLLVNHRTESAGVDVFELRPVAGAELDFLTGSETDDWGAVFSPDGRWVAYTSDRAGTYEVYVARYPIRDGEGAVKVSAHQGAEEPHWSFEGDAVLYRSGGGWWRVPVRFDPDPVPGRPELVAEGSFINVPGKSWDLLPDGRLLLGDGPRESTVDRIHMIPNFAAEIERRLDEGGE